MPKNLIIAVLVALLATTGTLTIFAASQTVETTADVEVTVWKHATTEAIYLSTRPAGGAWTTQDTPVDLSSLSASGRFYQGDALTVSVPVSVTVEAPDPPASTTEPPQAQTPQASAGLPTPAADAQDKWEYHAELSQWFTYTGSAWWQGQRLGFTCIETQLGTVVTPYAHFSYGDDYTYRDSVLVSYQIDGGPVTTGSWSTPTIHESATLPTAFLAAIRTAQTVTLQATAYDPVTFTLDGHAGAVMDDLGCFD